MSICLVNKKIGVLDFGIIVSQDECGWDTEHARIGEEGGSQVLVDQYQ